MKQPIRIFVDNKKFKMINISILSFFIICTVVLIITGTIYFAWQRNYDFLAFFILLYASVIAFLCFFMIYILDYGSFWINHYHKGINPLIKDGFWKKKPNSTNHFYKKYKPYIKLIIKLQIWINLLAVFSIFLLLCAFILLDVIFSLPTSTNLFTTTFIDFSICAFSMGCIIIVYHHICKQYIKIRYKKYSWNYSILYSFLLSTVNQEINILTQNELNLGKAKKFIIHIRTASAELHSAVKNENSDSMDTKYDVLKSWTKNWISPLLVLLWSLFIVFIPTIVIWWLDMKDYSTLYSFKLMISFVILMIIVFYYYVSVCLFYFFIFNNFQLHKHEDEKYPKENIKRIIFENNDVKSGKATLDHSLSKTKLFFILGILKKIFQDFDFNKLNLRKTYYVYIKDKIYDLTEYDYVYLSLYTDGPKIPLSKNLLILKVQFKNYRDFIVNYQFLNASDNTSKISDEKSS